MSADSSSPRRALVIGGFLIIYIVWGSTYLAIRVAVETMPPFLMAGTRFLIAGLLLYAWLLARKTPAPTPAQWRSGVIAGILLLLGGNGLVVWAEQTVPSGIASSIIGLAPVWFALLEWLRPGGTRPQGRAVLGILVGLIGVLLLVTSRRPAGADRTLDLWGVFALACAGILWAAGSLFTRHSKKAPSPWMNAAVQMICGGMVLLLTSAMLGEFARLNWMIVTPRSIVAFVYLVVFGSWIGFSVYVWLLKVSTPSRVATYAYVNPIIAVFLGWALLDETVNAQTFWSASIIIGGVIIITLPGVAPNGRGNRRLPS